MKAVLVRPPFYALFGLTTPKMKTYPLNLLYLATYARDRAGHQVAIVDGENIYLPELAPSQGSDDDPEFVMHQGIHRMLSILANPEHRLWYELERRILEQNPNLVGITCNSGNMDTVRIIVRRLKSHGIRVILGGSHPTVLPNQSINYTSADMVAVGEAEDTLARVLDVLEGKDSLEDIPSLVWKQDQHIQTNPKTGQMLHVDDLPIPDRSFVNRSDYFGEVIMTGRGCPFNCAYCASRNIWGRKVRFRSIPSIIQELELLRASAESGEQIEKEELRPGRWVVKIVDDMFTVNKKRIMKLLDEIIDRGLNCFEFTGGVRADSLDKELVDRMKSANIQRVTLGVESGSPKILKLIHKGESNKHVKKALTLLREAGIKSHTFFMIGFPEETPEDIEMSKRLIEDIQPDHVEINMVTPYPGTELFDMLIDEDPSEIDRWYRWFHQGMATHSQRIGYDLDAAYEDFLEFTRQYHATKKESSIL